MSYTPQLVLAPGLATALVTQAGLCGLPSTPFRYMLFSMVVCLPENGGVHSSIALSNNTALGTWQVDSTEFSIVLRSAAAMPSTLDAHLAHNSIGVRSHVLMSIDSVAQVLQVYINDVPLAITSGGWIGAGTTLNPDSFYSNWNLIGNGGTGPPNGDPAVADMWLAAPTSFFDLSIAANRRKFINRDLSLVDLGSDGSEPLGVAPPIFLTVRPGDSIANHFAHNNGSGGGPWTLHVPAIAFEPGGICTIPASGSLAMDNLLAFAGVKTSNQVFLEWSDDRGRSYGNPVGQPIGDRGEYLTSIQWQRIGYARDRVFRITWSVPVATALQGAWIELDSRAKS